jgi:hypothetical protein
MIPAARAGRSPSRRRNARPGGGAPGARRADRGHRRLTKLTPEGGNRRALSEGREVWGTVARRERDADATPVRHRCGRGTAGGDVEATPTRRSRDTYAPRARRMGLRDSGGQGRDVHGARSGAARARAEPSKRNPTLQGRFRPDRQWRARRMPSYRHPGLVPGSPVRLGEALEPLAASSGTGGPRNKSGVTTMGRAWSRDVGRPNPGRSIRGRSGGAVRRP